MCDFLSYVHICSRYDVLDCICSCVLVLQPVPTEIIPLWL
jgi:hypothetical protein